MKRRQLFLVLAILFMHTIPVIGQQTTVQKEIKRLERQKETLVKQEKKALKEEVASINQRLEAGVISEKEAQQLKEEVAKKRALNIENQVAILENKKAFLERNGENAITVDTTEAVSRIEIGLGATDKDGTTIFGVRFDDASEKNIRYDRRTYKDFVLAFGLNNALIEGQSINDSPYKIGGSRFFEFGWQWRTRVFKKSNWLRFNYGLSFQFNGLKPNNNQYFVSNGDQTELQEFDVELDKSKFRMDNLVFPFHFEFGPSKLHKSEDRIRYSLRNQFRVGIGGYGGFNIGTRQKLKYKRDGERIKDKFKRDYNTNDLIYGLSAYAGFDSCLLYVKYDLNPIFNNAAVEQRNISLGVRFDLD